ncbi:MAG: hypothetical protein ACLR7Z_20185 [Bilophila wadsworthia]
MACAIVQAQDKGLIDEYRVPNGAASPKRERDLEPLEAPQGASGSQGEKQKETDDGPQRDETPCNAINGL